MPVPRFIIQRHQIYVGDGNVEYIQTQTRWRSKQPTSEFEDLKNSTSLFTAKNPIYYNPPPLGSVFISILQASDNSPSVADQQQQMVSTGKGKQPLQHSPERLTVSDSITDSALLSTTASEPSLTLLNSSAEGATEFSKALSASRLSGPTGKPESLC